MKTRPSVLDVGQCDMDHGAIAAMLHRAFGAKVDRAHGAADACAAFNSGRYDLILVNRIFDRDGDQGLDLVRRLKANAGSAHVPVMLVSNFADAQQAAVAAGAVTGFGKAALDARETIELLRRHLGACVPTAGTHDAQTSV